MVEGDVRFADLRTAEGIRSEKPNAKSGDVDFWKCDACRMPRNRIENAVCCKCFAERGSSRKVRPSLSTSHDDNIIDEEQLKSHGKFHNVVAQNAIDANVKSSALDVHTSIHVESFTSADQTNLNVHHHLLTSDDWRGKQLRNVAVIAHVDHGKTTLSDALISRAGLLNAEKAGDQNTGRSLDTTKEERERGITIKATGITLDYELPVVILERAEELTQMRLRSIGCNHNTKMESRATSAKVTTNAHDFEQDTNALSPFTVNLIDSPGHVDFSGEVSSALRMTDGALLVVDAVDGKSCQTDTVLLQALQERVRPVLMLNKVDRLIIEKQLSPEAVYDRFLEVINDINDTILNHSSADHPENLLSLEKGNVAFGSGYFQWSATIDSFVDMMRPGLTQTAREKFKKNLSKKHNFVKGVLGPIFRVHQDVGLCMNNFNHDGGTSSSISSSCQSSSCSSLMENKSDKHGTHTSTPWLTQFNNRMSKIGRVSRVKAESIAGLPPRKVLKKLMAIFLPAADPLLSMIAQHLPSPVEAMQWRTSHLYEKDDDVRKAMSVCAVDGATVVYVSKMVQPDDVGSKRGGLLAVARVFSGTVRVGDVLRVAGSTKLVKVGSVQQCVGRSMRTVDSAFAGQIVALTGVSSGICKNGTLTSSPDAVPINGMQLSVSPVVQKAISPIEPRQLKKMVSAMQEIVQADQTALFYQHPETKQHVLAGAGELHLEVLLHSLEDSGIKTKVSNPMVNFREGVTVASCRSALKKSSNKHNRLWFEAQPIPPLLVKDLETKALTLTDPKLMAQKLISRHGWDKASAHRIWQAGPDDAGVHSGDTSGPTCLLVNSTVGLQIPGDVRDTIIRAFEEVVREGVLARSPLRGIRFDLVDAKFHSESTHRSSPQVLPAAKSAMRGAFMLSSPCLIEPLFRVEISGHGGITSAYDILGKRRARILQENISETTGEVERIVAELSVRTSFGLLDELRGASSGKAFATTMFGGWKQVSGNPSDADSGGEARSIVESERRLKRHSPTVPTLCDFIDKL